MALTVWTEPTTFDSNMNAGKFLERSESILGGTVVFAGTRVPVRTLIDYLESGERLDDFLEDFPTVTREQAIAVLELAGDSLARAS